MALDVWLLQALILLGAAVLVVPLFEKAGLGSVLGYIAAGFLVGPVLGLFGSESQDMLHFAELGVVLLLFVIGLELQPARLWALRASIFVAGGLQVAVTATLLALVAIGLGLGPTTAIIIGLGLSLSSTAAPLEAMAERHELATHPGRSATAILLFQDLTVIPILAYIGQDTGQQDLWLATGQAVLVLAGVLAGGRYLLRPFFRFVASTRNQGMLTAAGLFVLLGIGALMQLAGLSMALGAFVAGVLLADSEYRHELEARIEPFKGVLIGLFFLALGMSFDLWLLLSDPVMIVALVAGLMTIKLVVLVLLGKRYEHSNQAATTLGFALAQGGEFAFVIFSAAVAAQLMAPAIAAVLTVVVVLSMAATPPLAALNRMLWRYRQGPGDDAIESRKLRAFVSYARSDADAATRFVQLLEAEGFENTIDTRDLPFGEEWQAELDHHIRQSDTVIWLISPASIHSKWCRWELDKVAQYRKRLVPIMLAEVPPADLPGEIGRVQVLPQAGVFDLADAAQARLLTDTLRANRSWLKEHTRLAERARLWTGARRSPDWLLRGAELAAAEQWRDARPQGAPDPGTPVLDLIHSSRIAAASL